MTRTVHVTVRGRVQGVGYRAWTAGEALRLGLAGHVRNRRDGSVEAVLSGPAEVVETLLGRMREGPPAARVDDLACEERAGESNAERDGGRPEGFAVLPTS